MQETKVNTGGPAFPLQTDRFPDGELLGERNEGMTTRDYFAAKAMQACLARGDDTNRPGIAEWSYSMADAMLKARSK